MALTGARNKILAGDYLGYTIFQNIFGKIYLQKIFSVSICLDGSTVEKIEVVDSDKQKSGGSAIARAAIGNFFLGPIGLLAAAGAKNKNIITITIDFKDGRRSLAEVDQEIYQSLLSKVFK